MLKDIELILTQVYYIYYIGLFLIVYKWFYDWNRLKAAILGLWFVKSMMFNCGNPREPLLVTLGDPWWILFTNNVNENDANGKGML